MHNRSEIAVMSKVYGTHSIIDVARETLMTYLLNFVRGIAYSVERDSMRFAVICRISLTGDVRLQQIP